MIASYSNTYKKEFFFLGFVIAFNFYLIPFTNNSPRGTDLVSLYCLASLLYKWRTTKQIDLRHFIIIFYILFAALIWLNIGFYKSHQAGIVEPIRWIILIIPAYYLFLNLRTKQLKKWFFKGFFWGTLAHLIVIFVQLTGFGDYTKMFGLASNDANFEVLFAGIFRPPGMYSHVNGSAAVISLIVPLTIGFVDEKIISKKWILLAAGILILSTILTLNRSSFLVSVIIILIWITFNIDRRLVLTLFAISFSLVIAFGYFFEPPGGWSRWFSYKSLYRNFSVRWLTVVESIKLIAENPFGMGSDYADELSKRTYSRGAATHNAWLQLSLSSGLFLPIIIFIGFLTKITNHIFYKKSLLGWLSIHLFGLFMFEEFLTNMVIILFTIYILFSLFDYHIYKKVYVYS